jgi:exodeoxyribonuclease VII large subunit
LVALSPNNILERGYALVFDAAGNLVKDASQLHPGDEISARVARGSFTANAKTIKG